MLMLSSTLKHVIKRYVTASFATAKGDFSDQKNCKKQVSYQLLNYRISTLILHFERNRF